MNSMSAIPFSLSLKSTNLLYKILSKSIFPLKKKNIFSFFLLIITMKAKKIFYSTGIFLFMFAISLQAETQYRIATFAGGCFWCMEGPFEKLNGVKQVISGYAGGEKENPTYEDVSSGSSGYVEAVQITFDPSAISYEKLLEVFWKQIDPTDPDGQFADRGKQYRTLVFTHDEDQKKKALQSKQDLEESAKFSKPIATEITPFTTFYPAEEYHQDYYKKHSAKYKFYRLYSGREGFLKKTWGK